MKKINHYQYKEICLAIKNDLNFEEFQILCGSWSYSEDYINKIWRHFSDKPLDFVLYHDLGRDIFEYLYFKLKIAEEVQQP